MGGVDQPEGAMTTVRPAGLHHVTAIATDPQANADFYLNVLGMRLVKQTVNFDAPDTYHLYYADEVGTPGTILTFFPWPNAKPGVHGTGQVTRTAFTVPEGSLGWWRSRLSQLDIATSDIEDRGSEVALSLHDPDGLIVELVEHEEDGRSVPWTKGPVGDSYAVRALHAVTLTEDDHEKTAGLFADDLGFGLVAESGDGVRFSADGGAGGSGALVDLVSDPSAPRGLVAAGTVHHIAWRAPDDAAQEVWRGELVEQGLNVTQILDRNYFRSIYFREPGGVLLEIATDPPGFAVDEPLLELGRHLRLPPWLEPNREEIQRNLPALRLPEQG